MSDHANRILLAIHGERYDTPRETLPHMRKAKGLRLTGQHKLKLFPTRGPSQDIAVDILGPFPKTRNDNLHVVVIIDRYSKLTRAITMRKITSGLVATVVINNWILPHGITDSILTDNGAQFVAKCFKKFCHLMGIKRRTTTAYHPQTNGQAERYNKTIAARLRHYVGEHQDDWDRYVQPLTYWYKNQPNCTTGTTPFNLANTRAPPSPVESISKFNLK